jgi:hypothetical protein
MDFEAIAFASEKCLEDLGLNAKGDVLALKAFVQRHGNNKSGKKETSNRGIEKRQGKPLNAKRKETKDSERSISN